MPTGIHDGFGSPWPCLLSISRKPSLVLRLKVVIELSRCCMTRAIIVRSLQRVGFSSRSIFLGSSLAWSSSCRQRGMSLPPGPAPSVISVCSRPIALEPLP